MSRSRLHGARIRIFDGRGYRIGGVLVGAVLRWGRSRQFRGCPLLRSRSLGGSGGCIFGRRSRILELLKESFVDCV